MPVFYKTCLRGNPMDKGAPKKAYAVQKMLGTVEINDLAKQVASVSGHSPGTVAGICLDMLEAIPHFLGLGYTVDFGPIGYLQIRLNSEGADAPEMYKISSGLKKVNCHLSLKAPFWRELNTATIQKMQKPKEIVEP